MEDASKVAASILKNMDHKGPMSADAPASPDDSSSSDPGLQAAGEDIMSAFKSGDVDTLVSALQSFMQLAQE